MIKSDNFKIGDMSMSVEMCRVWKGKCYVKSKLKIAVVGEDMVPCQNVKNFNTVHTLHNYLTVLLIMVIILIDCMIMIIILIHNR